MTTPRLITVNDFTASTYADLADQTDALLSDVLVMAEDSVEKYIGYSILQKSYTETIRAKSQTIFVKNRPVNSVTEVKKRPSPYSSWLLVYANEYQSDFGAGYFEFDVPIKGYDVEITYNAGFATTPNDIKSAIIIQAALALTPDLELYGAGDSKEPGTKYMKTRIEELLCPYKRSVTPYR